MLFDMFGLRYVVGECLSEYLVDIVEIMYLDEGTSPFILEKFWASLSDFSLSLIAHP